MILRYLLIGKLTRDYIIPLNRKAYSDIPGGSLPYTAGGMALWDHGGGLVGKVGEDYPTEWLDNLSAQGFDSDGVSYAADLPDARRFFVYENLESVSHENPLTQYSEIGANLPKSLLGFTPPLAELDSKTRLTAESISPKDIPFSFLDVTFAHICPLDYLSHLTLPTYLRQKRATTITLRPSEGYFQPLFWEEIPAVVKDLTAFHCDEQALQNLFHGKTSDLWEMAETIAGFGVENVVIYRRSRGQYLYNQASRQKWSIPPYPARIIDPTGEIDAFCGGFLAGFRATYDPIEATVYGNISASITVEGVGPLYLLDTLPGLAQARFQTVRNGVRQV
ncbi:MAG: carbohydrate kinase family protein [Anaerolineae bacterium]|nr:carbohydrate kinase family protein [Anaerolineae bacterium]